MAKSADAKKPNELYINRVYNAPVKAVWDAWTDPEQVAQWWGPRGFTIKHHAKDLRPGGFWRYDMLGPDGKIWENKTVYHEVEKYKKLVYDHGGGENTPPLFRVTVLFSETKGKTLMEMTMHFPNAEAFEGSKKVIKNANGNSTWDRLGEYLEKNEGGKEKFIINRTFEVPLETMYDVWTSPKHFVKWLPPTGFEMEILKGDIRQGSGIFYRMFNDQVTMYGKVEYLQLHRPDRLVYTQQFSDKNEGVARHPMAPTWPETMMTTVTLASESPNETRVTVEWEATGKYTAEELNTFITARAGMMQGWTGSFDKLENYLSTL